MRRALIGVLVVVMRRASIGGVAGGEACFDRGVGRVHEASLDSCVDGGSEACFCRGCWSWS